MNKTKRRILDASRALFNEFGVGAVSQRRISDHLGISPGNLTYHFKKSEDIVEALYFELVETIDHSMEELKGKEPDLYFIIKMIDRLVDCFFEYRFFFLDFVQIMRSHEQISRHYEKLSALRRQQFTAVTQNLIRTGLMRKEELPHEYEYLYERFNILADFWISSAEVRKAGTQDEQKEKSKQMLRQSLYPYLSPEGKKLFLSAL